MDKHAELDSFRKRKIFEAYGGHSSCDAHVPAPQRYMSTDVQVRVCAKCGRQYEPKTGITYQQ